MTDNDRRATERAENVHLFGETNRADWPPDSEPADDFAKLALVVARLPKAAVRQVRTTVSGTTEALLGAIWTDFKDIARTARAIEEKSGEVGFAAPFALPHQATEHRIKRHADDLLGRLEDVTGPKTEVADSTEALAAKAALRARFVRFLMPAGFVADLRHDRDAIDQKNAGKEADNQEGNAGTAEIEAALKEAAMLVKSLNASMCNLYRNDPVKLAAWQAASRVERAPRRNGAGEMPAPETPAAATA